MPDEYGLPTTEEYEAMLRQTQQDQLMAGRASGAGRGGQIGGTVGSAVGTLIAPGAGTAIGSALGTAAGAGIGAAIGGGRARERGEADRLRGERVLAALEEAQREGILSDTEYQEIANRFLVPGVAQQRASQQRRLQQAAGLTGTQPGATFRTQQAADAAAAEDQLRVQAAIQEAADREEQIQREALLRMVEGEEERAGDAEDEMRRRADEAFQQFAASAEEIGTMRGEEEAVAEQMAGLKEVTGEDFSMEEFRELMAALKAAGITVGGGS